jgi:hypothetical protein
MQLSGRHLIVLLSLLVAAMPSLTRGAAVFPSRQPRAVRAARQQIPYEAGALHVLVTGARLLRP